MAINWTPWFDVPLERRLQLFSVGFLMFCAIILPALSLLLVVYLLFAGNIYWKTICVLYIAFIYYDRHTGDRGGRGAGISWIRSMNVWRHCVNYFPLDMVKTVDLPADRNYLICFFPHGILSFGAFVSFNSNHSKWSKLFPGIRSKVATLGTNLLLPITREILLSFGVCSASANSLTTLLQQPNNPNDKSNQDGYTSNGVGLVVGGAQESFYAVPHTYKCVLKSRKGFAKIALKTGASLVPAISFGENNLFEIIDYKPGSWGRFIQDSVKRLTKVAPIHFNGRGYLQYDYGIIPRRQKITTVIGAPIKVERILKPTEDDVDRIHELFCTQLKELFEAHKSKYVENSDEVKLEII
ncbi:2-acylglycerol O-acyltransferase 2-like isoform X2 [Sitodiplosis mosellana]|uniref:2-acylglycerol O-acyltransferase 2-like isoform X2 n=1 Tax=Sitodiplosis mosellana TaxID=263140 RepID=UPI002444D516|nr:2-acylglycerol O-acyltransferase 2-like isoform X2 [Sitodiplosis mosellana]